MRLQSSAQTRLLAGCASRAKVYFKQCKSPGLNYTECVKRVARRMPDMGYSLLKSGRNYDRSVVELAIQKRQEQVANARPQPRQRSLAHS
jgi:hypothetical protein